MTTTTLYIIGNGFDIFHRIPSQYSDFKKYVKSQNLALYDHVNEYLPVKENWSDLEIAFSLLDVDQVIDEAMQHLQSYGVENWSDAFHHDYQYVLNEIVSDLSSKLKSHFCEWISLLELPLYNNLASKPLEIDKSAIFFTFNYTRTLQDVYDIHDEDVLHVHGESEQNQSQIILGHSWNPEEIPNLNDVPNPEDMDTRVMEGNELINDYFGKTFKDSQTIIEENSYFFSSLTNIEKVYVLGHSLSEVDTPYFEEIVKTINKDAVWVVTYFGEDELYHHKNIIKNLGINNVSFCLLSEI